LQRHEWLSDDGTVVDLGIRDLEPHVPIVLEIVSEIDGRDAAFAGPLLDAVAVRKGGLEG